MELLFPVFIGFIMLSVSVFVSKKKGFYNKTDIGKLNDKYTKTEQVKSYKSILNNIKTIFSLVAFITIYFSTFNVFHHYTLISDGAFEVGVYWIPLFTLLFIMIAPLFVLMIALIFHPFDLLDEYKIETPWDLYKAIYTDFKKSL